MAPGRALQALAVALAVGEGCTWLALGLMVCSLWLRRGNELQDALEMRTLPERAAQSLRTLGGAPVALGLYGAAGLAAYALGPYGLLRPGALGHCLPVLAWPVVAHTARRAAPHERRRAVLTFVVAVLAAALLGAVASVPWRERLQAWVRLNRFVGEQSLRPDSLLPAVGGLYFHRLKMAHVLLLALAWPIALIFVPEGRVAAVPKDLKLPGWGGPRRLWAGAAPWLLLAAASVALAYTFARAAYLAAAAGTAAVWLGAWFSPQVSRRRLSAWAACGVAVAMLAVTFVPEVRARMLSSSSQEAAAVRAVIWTEAVTIAWEHPFGIGLGNYPEVVAGYYAALEPLTKSPRTYPHNLLWMAWAEGGLLGVCAMALFWARLGVAACGAMLSVPAGHISGLGRRRAGAALLFATVALAAVGCTHDVLFHNIVALAFFCGLGLASAALPTPKEVS